VRIREIWRGLGEDDRAALSLLAAHGTVARLGLRRKGLLTPEGTAFGRVLLEWLREAAR
jgi:hypothetical protein